MSVHDAPPRPDAAVPPPPPVSSAVAPTNGMAVASLVLGITGWFFFVLPIPSTLAVVFGFIARARIRRSIGAQRGGGMAIAGIILGFTALAFFGLMLFAMWDVCNNDPNCFR